MHVLHVDNLNYFFNLLPVPLYRTSPEGRLLAANEALAELLGYSSTTELMAAPIDVESYYVDPAVRDSWISDIQDNGRVEELDFELTRPDGSTIWVRDTARVALGPDGKALYYEGALVDVSEKVRLQHSRDEFIATVSHELRNPITAILGLSQEMADAYETFEDAERKKIVELIARESEEVAWLIEDLLVAHYDVRRDLTLAPTTFSVRPEVERIALMLEPRIPVEESGEVSVFADPGRTRQILRNLLSNARRYGGDDVAVEIGVEGGMAVIRVCDNGDRIEEDVAAVIFKPFEQDRRRAQPNSMGLGLPVSRKLARLMGGEVEYSYVDGRSCFSLSLPQG